MIVRITELICLSFFGMSTLAQHSSTQKIQQFLLSQYSNVTTSFVVLASLPFDPLWVVITIALMHIVFDSFLQSKTRAFSNIAIGVFYGLAGATSNFYQPNLNPLQKPLFFILLAKYTRNSRRASWILLLVNALIIYFVNINYSSGIFKGMVSIFNQLWIPFLILLITELPRPLKKEASEALRKKEEEPKSKQKLEDLSAENKMLREKLSSFEDFLATSFHELKNPLNVILGCLKLMTEQPSAQNEELSSNIKRAFSAGEYLRVMITSTLDWRKYNFRDLEMSYKEVDTLAFMSKLWGICSTLIKNKNLQGFFRASKELPPKMVIDEQRMMQIVINLISNAVKFTTKGYVSIEFQWVPTVMVFRKIDRNERPRIGSSLSEKIDGEKITVYSSGKHKFLSNRVNYYELNNKKETWDPSVKLGAASTQGVLKIKVDDSGCGMDQGQIELLFQKFSQVNLDTTVNQMGSGLGLWISKQFIDKMNGTIKVSSVLNKGTTFEIAIPTKPLPPSLSSISSIHQKPLSPNSKNSINLLSEKDQPGEIPYKSKKVLIVDDDKFNITILRQWCKKQGYSTFEATNGKQAATLVESNVDEIGVILMDEEMPQMKGREAISLINSFCREKGMTKIPSFCLSGNSAPKFEEECIKAGFDAVMQKPIDYETLNANLNKALRKQTKKTSSK